MEKEDSSMTTNINCSANCRYQNNGKCTLNHVSISSSFTGAGADCAYFQPQKPVKTEDNKHRRTQS